MHTVYYIFSWKKDVPEKENNVCTTFYALYSMECTIPDVFDTGYRQ